MWPDWFPKLFLCYIFSASCIYDIYINLWDITIDDFIRQYFIFVESRSFLNPPYPCFFSLIVCLKILTTSRISFKLSIMYFIFRFLAFAVLLFLFFYGFTYSYIASKLNNTVPFFSWDVGFFFRFWVSVCIF